MRLLGAFSTFLRTAHEVCADPSTRYDRRKGAAAHHNPFPDRTTSSLPFSPSAANIHAVSQMPQNPDSLLHTFPPSPETVWTAVGQLCIKKRPFGLFVHPTLSIHGSIPEVVLPMRRTKVYNPHMPAAAQPPKTPRISADPGKTSVPSLSSLSPALLICYSLFAFIIAERFENSNQPPSFLRFRQIEKAQFVYCAYMGHQGLEPWTP